MNDADARAILARVSYIKPWSFVLTHTSASTPWSSIIINFEVPDSDNPEQPFFGAWAGSSFDLAEIHTTEQLMLMLHRTVERFESHELLEGLKIDGTRIWDPHFGGHARRMPTHEIYFETVNA